MSRLLLASALALGLAASVYAQSSPLSPTAERAALDYLRAQPPTMAVSEADVSDLVVSSGHRSALSGINYVYVQQRRRGIPVVDGIVTVAVDGSGRVVHAAGDLVSGLDAPTIANAASLSAAQALEVAAGLVGAASTPTVPVETEAGPTQFTTFGQVAAVDVTAHLVYASTGRSVVLAWELQVPTADAQHVWVVRVDAGTGAELSRYDLVVSDHWGEPAAARTTTASASMAPFVEAVPSPALPALDPADGSSYLVYPVPYESPQHGPTPAPPADGRTTVTEPADATASPYGWHDTDGADGAEYTVTWGNNVRAYQDRANDNTGTTSESPDGGAALDFSFPLDLTQGPATYTAAAVTNLFYWNNIIHDIKYQYGFDEASGNFQVNNYGRGGSGNDDVRAEGQDGGGTNNANMFTPADGSQPRMQMYEWTESTPRRDGDLDAGIIIHEYTHGTSNRLVGGPSQVGCMSNSEQMGEGISDYYGLMFTQKVGDTGPLRRGIGTYALNEPTDGPGIRPSPYSTDFAENDYTYGDASGLAIPHGVGFVWATIMWEVTWELIDAHGFDPDFYNAAGTAGNQVALALHTEGMKLAPCSPGFVDMRDAILAADAALYPDASAPGRGLHYDLLWAGFARRGLGASADQGSSATNSDNVEAFDTPITPGVVEISPTELTFNLTTGGTSSGEVTISNTGVPGDGTVQYTASITRQSQPPDEDALATGGPDAFGYAWVDSDEPDGPAVDFQDISGTGTAVTYTAVSSSFPAADEGYADVALPFTFNFYGQDKSSVRIYSNGFLTFSTTSGNSWTNPTSFPGASSPTNFNDVIAVFWDDLDGSAGGTTYYEELPDGRFVVQWDEVPRYFDSGSSVTAQAILSEDGTIEIQYGTIVASSLTSNSVGLENADGTVGLEVTTNDPYVTSDKAVLFYSPIIWASVAPTSGTLEEGESEDLTVTVDATELPAGIYSADLIIETNDADALSTTVTIELTVSDDGVTSIVVDGSKGYRYLGPPAEGVTVDDLADQNLVRGVPGYYPGASPNLYTEYDAETNSWVPSDGTGETLELGKAFKWFMYDRAIGNPEISESVELPFTLSTTLAANTSDVTVELQTDGTRFNYLANPFGEDLDLSGLFGWPGSENLIPAFGVQVYDDASRTWVAAPTSIGPWEAFRVRSKGPRRPGNENPRTLTIPASEAGPTPAVAATAAREADAAAGIDRLAFALRGTDLDGRALADRSFSVAFTGAARAALDDDDAPKTAVGSEAYALFGARVGGQFVGTDARPFAAGEVPLAIDARGAARAFTLSWDAAALPAGLPVVLVDLQTGAEVDVRTRSSYAFEVAPRPALSEVEASEAGELADGAAAADRFVLRIGAVLANAEAIDALALESVAPNPSSTSARVAFAVPTAGSVRVSVVDVRGREVAVLVDGPVAAGRHEATLEAGRLAAGVYLIRLEAGGEVVTRQAAVVR